jgi:GNAT superfamily N-acetyltransferase
MAVKIEEVAFGSEKYKALLEIRYEILRKPLGLELSAKDTASDSSEFHIAAVADEQPVGCVLLRPIDSKTIKLRQMAVSDAYRGQGVGAKLIGYAEALAAARGFKTMEMHARKSARVFYEKQGYAAEGGEFIEVTVPTLKMWKHL